MSALHEISSRYLEAMNALTEPGAEVPDDVIADTMEALGGELEDKAVNVAKYIKNLEAEAEAIGKAVEGMGKRIKAINDKAERLRSYLKAHMSGTGTKR